MNLKNILTALILALGLSATGAFAEDSTATTTATPEQERKFFASIEILAGGSVSWKVSGFNEGNPSPNKTPMLRLGYNFSEKRAVEFGTYSMEASGSISSPIYYDINVDQKLSATIINYVARDVLSGSAWGMDGKIGLAFLSGETTVGTTSLSTSGARLYLGLTGRYAFTPMIEGIASLHIHPGYKTETTSGSESYEMNPPVLGIGIRGNF